MRALIIGGTGLISTPLTIELLERGIDVTHFNRNRVQTDVPDPVHRLIGDRTDREKFESVMRATDPFDCVFDMVCYDPRDAESLVSAFKGRVGHLVVCSTVDVYQKPPRAYPISDDTPHGPAPWAYAVNKARIEAILGDAHGRGDFPVTILRPAFTYGDGRGLVHSLGGRTSYFDRLRKGKPIVVHGDGSSLWVSCHAIDVARAFANAGGSSQTFGNSYHLTGEEWMTWNDYHRTVAAVLGGPEPELIHIPSNLLARFAPNRAGICAVNFQYNNIFDNTAAQTELDFRYTISFREGVCRVVSWLDANGGIENCDEDVLEDRIIAAWREHTQEMVDRLSLSNELS